MLERKTKRFRGVVKGVSKQPPYEVWVQDEEFPLDFGPHGRLTMGLSFFLFQAQGCKPRMKPGDLRNFGSNGIVKDVRIWCYYQEYGQILSVIPRIL